MKQKKLNGSITLFFSVVLFLLISMVLVSVESARHQAAAAILQSNVSLAMASLGGSYYAPLYDEFDIYGLYKEDIIGDLQHYLSASADPIRNLPEGYAGSEKSGYSFVYSEPEITVNRKYMLTDANGEFVRRQMVTAGAYGGAEALIDELLEAIGVLKEQETGLELLEEKAAVEEKLTAMEMLLLELASSMDGVPTNMSGIVCDEEGRIHPNSSFAKKILLSEPTREGVGIDSFGVFFYLQPKYVVLPDLLSEMEALCTEGTEGDFNEILFSNRVNELLDLLNFTILEAEYSRDLTEQMITLQQDIRPMVSGFEDMLAQSGDLLNSEWKEMLGESLSTMHEYIGDTGTFYDLPVMRNRLQDNIDILSSVRDVVLQIKWHDSPEQRLEGIANARDCLNGYSLEGLSIRYEGMHRGTTVKHAFLKAVKNLLTEGLTAGVINSSEVSTNRLNSRQLPSKTIGLDENNLFRIDIPDDILEDDGTAVWSVIRKMNLSKAVTILRNGAESLLEKMLLVTYDSTHFSDYSSDDGKSPLKYELEYILYGNERDSDNLRRAALTILGIRLVMNLIHTFTNPEKRGKALVTATEVFGVGIPFLTKACQYVILLAWGLQNAKLETVEILSGKKVPFLVSSASFQIAYNEITTMSKDKRFERAEQYKDAAGIAPQYKTYLMLLMMFRKDETLVMRSMDLIQESLRISNQEFLLQDCYAGLTVTVQSSIRNRYSDLSFSRFDGGDGAIVEAVGTVLY